MSSPSQLSTAQTLSSSDQIIFYSTINGSTRKASLETLLAWIEANFADPNFQRVTASPTLAGFTLTLPSTANSLFVLLTPTGTMATGTISLPPASGAADGQEIILYSSQEVTALSFTLNGAAAVNGAPSGVQAGASFTLRFDAPSVAWYVTEKPVSVGSGTVDYVPKWTGPTTLGNSIIRDNGTEAAVGVAPIAGKKFSVNGDTFAFKNDEDTTVSVVNASSTAPRSALFDAANFTGGTTATAGLRATLSRGTLLVPSAVLSGDDLGAFISRAYDGAGYFEAGRIQFDAQSNWAAARSSSLTLSTCAAGTVSPRLYISPTGNVELATASTTFTASGAGQGVLLAATPSSASPNVLDCYEEATFTPVYNGTGVVGTVAFSARYQRTGNVVNLELTVVVGAASSWTWTTATDYFDNLPAAITPSVSVMSTGSFAFDFWNFIVFRSGAVFRLAFSKSGSASFLIPASTTIRSQLSYLI